jgi:hypothetical protein
MECVHRALQFLATAHSIYSWQHIPSFSGWGEIKLRASRVKKMLIEKILQDSVLSGFITMDLNGAEAKTSEEQA